MERRLSMKFNRQLIAVSILIFTTLLFGCGGGGGGGSSSSGTGTLSMSLTDSSTSTYKAIYVTIDEVQVNRNDSASNGNAGWTTVATPGKTYNLLTLVNGLTAVLGDKELESGTYHQIRLIIGRTPESGNNMLGVPHPYANYVILNDGKDTTAELKTPSGWNTGIKLVHNFQVLDNATVELVLDFDACRSVVETGNGSYLLKPTIKVIGTADKSNVYGTVSDEATNLPIAGALVSAQDSEGLFPTVVRATLTSSESGENGQYSLSLPPGQQYNVVAYTDQKVGADGSQQMYAPACSNITVPDTGESNLDFALKKTGFGTISGTVTVNGSIDPDNPPTLYVHFYRTLGCGYVEIKNLPISPDPNTQTFSYSADLPFGTYDVVVTGDGFNPETQSQLHLSSQGQEINADFDM
jgi:hypothetical protein